MYLNEDKGKHNKGNQWDHTDFFLKFYLNIFYSETNLHVSLYILFMNNYRI